MNWVKRIGITVKSQIKLDSSEKYLMGNARKGEFSFRWEKMERTGTIEETKWKLFLFSETNREFYNWVLLVYAVKLVFYQLTARFNNRNKKKRRRQPQFWTNLTHVDFLVGSRIGDVVGFCKYWWSGPDHLILDFLFVTL